MRGRGASVDDQKRGYTCDMSSRNGDEPRKDTLVHHQEPTLKSTLAGLSGGH